MCSRGRLGGVLLSAVCPRNVSRLGTNGVACAMSLHLYTKTDTRVAVCQCCRGRFLPAGTSVSHGTSSSVVRVWVAEEMPVGRSFSFGPLVHSLTVSRAPCLQPSTLACLATLLTSWTPSSLRPEGHCRSEEGIKCFEAADKQFGQGTREDHRQAGLAVRLTFG